MRVQIPAYTDHWMKGDRYGDVIKVVLSRTTINGKRVELAQVKLDISGKIRKFVLDDCKEV